MLRSVLITIVDLQATESIF